jgi:Spy/CpxP family protein refolding chaperone
MKKLDVNMKVLIAIIALFGISLSLMAQSPQKQRSMQHRDQSGIAMLDLTEDQKAEIKTIHLAQMKAVQPLTDEVKINRAKINAAMNKDNPDMKEIVSLVEGNGKLLTDIQVKQIESKIEVRSLFTDEQKVIYDSHAGQHKRSRFIAQHRRTSTVRAERMDRMERMDRTERHYR